MSFRGTIAMFGALLAACTPHNSANSDGGSGNDAATVHDSLSSSPDVPVADGAVLPDSMIGQADAPSNTGLPPLPVLTNVVATQREDSVGIDFDPVDTAVDYRVYPLPTPGDVTTNSDGSLTIHNAIYRCAGTRQTYDLENNINTGSAGLTTFNAPYNWKAQTPANPTLGYVYVTPASDRVPVYAVAGYPMQIELGWRESRLKIYTTDMNARQMLLGQGWRDDGIVFYVPAAASASTQTVYSSAIRMMSGNAAGQTYSMNQQFYFLAADMATHASDTTPPAAAFQVLSAAADGTKPLMAVQYNSDQVHTELAVGQERYNRALNQGNGPLWHVEWAGITQPTTLVVEALKTGCPYQGFLAGQHLDAPPHQTFYTLADLQAASPTGEAFINGEYDNVPASPVPIARSFVQVAPQPHDPSAWDWYEGFNVGESLGTVTMLPFGPSNSTTCDWPGCRGQTNTLDWSAFELDAPMGVAVFSYGSQQGQLWAAFDDTGQDVTGRLRFTARQMASVSANSFLHATMSVNIMSTDRRYPQLIVSDQQAPIDCYTDSCNGLGSATSNTLLVQTIEGPSLRLEVQAFHGLVGSANWNVNNQAPNHELVDSTANFGLSDAAFAALSTTSDPPFEHAGMDRLTRFDAFVSSQRVYVFMDGQPAGCTQYPSDFALSGAVTVTFGNVLYHEGAPDELICADTRPYGFMHVHECQETSRHYDDLGFKSGVPAPQWNETLMPCAAY